MNSRPLTAPSPVSNPPHQHHHQLKVLKYVYLFCSKFYSNDDLSERSFNAFEDDDDLLKVSRQRPALVMAVQRQHQLERWSFDQAGRGVGDSQRCGYSVIDFFVSSCSNGFVHSPLHPLPASQHQQRRKRRSELRFLTIGT